MVQVLIIRGGKMLGEKIFKMKNQSRAEADETLTAFLKQYYAGETILPKEILLPHPIEDVELIADWLSEKKQARVRLDVPLRGKKRDLVAMAEENSRFALRTERDKGEVSTRMLEELQEALFLKNFPEVIEGFDISNISGTSAVGSLVQFRNAVADKDNYRRYKIKGVDGIDDYAMMREVMHRRYSRLLEEEKSLPNLILIDGGRGHLNTAHRVLCDLNLTDRIDLACIAKGKYRNNLDTDEVYLVDHKQPVLFRENSPSRFLLQRVRDESHRFAISFHRQLRNKRALSSPLESVAGIGKKRRLQLLKHFGSLEKIRNASLEDLTTMPGITEEIAQNILESTSGGNKTA
jgi:excinuclease ABC subunit C